MRASAIALREFVPDDHTALFDALRHPDVLAWLPAGASGKLGEEWRHRWVEKRVAGASDNEHVYLGVIQPASGRLIDSLSLDLADNELSYWIVADFQGQGYGKQAVETFLILLGECPLPGPFRARTILTNFRSQRVLASIGFQFVGFEWPSARGNIETLLCYEFVSL